MASNKSLAQPWSAFGKSASTQPVTRFLSPGWPMPIRPRRKSPATWAFDGAQPVIAGMAAAALEAEFAWRQVQLIVKDGQCVGVELVEAKRFADGAAGFVVIGLRFEQERLLGPALVSITPSAVRP
jgi:ribulose bisphosphate carboxylase small subunit